MISNSIPYHVPYHLVCLSFDIHKMQITQKIAYRIVFEIKYHYLLISIVI